MMLLGSSLSGSLFVAEMGYSWTLAAKTVAIGTGENVEKRVLRPGGSWRAADAETCVTIGELGLSAEAVTSSREAIWIVFRAYGVGKVPFARGYMGHMFEDVNAFEWRCILDWDISGLEDAACMFCKRRNAALAPVLTFSASDKLQMKEKGWPENIHQEPTRRMFFF